MRREVGQSDSSPDSDNWLASWKDVSWQYKESAFITQCHINNNTSPRDAS